MLNEECLFCEGFHNKAQKKREDSVLVTYPTPQGLRIARPNKISNAESSRRICISTEVDCIIYDTTYAEIITYPRSILHCFDPCLDDLRSCEVLRRQPKIKASCKR